MPLADAQSDRKHDALHVDGRRHQAVLDEELLVGLKALDVGVGQHAVVVGPARELFGVGERDAVFLRADGDGLLPVGLDPLVGLTLGLL